MIDVFWYPFWSKCFIQDDKPPWPKLWTYFIQIEISYIKIGKTKDPNIRLKQIEKSMPFKIHPLLLLDDRICTEDLTFSKFNCYRKRGEWFIPTPELLRFINNPREIFTWNLKSLIVE